MFAGGLVLGITLIAFASWLHWNERLGWPGERYDSELDRDYLDKRLRRRRRVHLLLFACGVLILVAAFAGRQNATVWLACWMSVILTLATVVGLALLDAVRTQRYHARKRGELRRRSFGDR